jgi:dienelactone hydrolase
MYFAYPKENRASGKAILFLSDVFGIYDNSKLLADAFAGSGYLTVIPDLFSGDAIQLGGFLDGKVDIQSWLKNHEADTIDLVVERSIKYLREELGIKRLGTVGYCFGGKVCTYKYTSRRYYRVKASESGLTLISVRRSFPEEREDRRRLHCSSILPYQRRTCSYRGASVYCCCR